MGFISTALTKVPWVYRMIGWEVVRWTSKQGLSVVVMVFNSYTFMLAIEVTSCFNTALLYQASEYPPRMEKKRQHSDLSCIHSLSYSHERIYQGSWIDTNLVPQLAL